MAAILVARQVARVPSTTATELLTKTEREPDALDFLNDAPNRAGLSILFSYHANANTDRTRWMAFPSGPGPRV